MLTDAETELAAYAIALRLDEQPECPRWFAVGDDSFLAADSLAAKGWLDRRCTDADVLWRASDAALVARELSNAVAAASSPN